MVKRRTYGDPEKMVLQAFAYVESALCLQNRIHDPDYRATPALLKKERLIVIFHCLGFSLELGFKALIALSSSQKEYPASHDLRTLWRKLCGEDRDKLGPLLAPDGNSDLILETLNDINKHLFSAKLRYRESTQDLLQFPEEIPDDYILEIIHHCASILQYSRYRTWKYCPAKSIEITQRSPKLVELARR